MLPEPYSSLADSANLHNGSLLQGFLLNDRPLADQIVPFQVYFGRPASVQWELNGSLSKGLRMPGFDLLEFIPYLINSQLKPLQRCLADFL